MNLLKFLQYYNSYYIIGGEDQLLGKNGRLNLFEVFKSNWIFHQNSIDQIIGFIRESTLAETLELIDEEVLEKDSVSNKTDLVRAVLERSWLTLQLEKKMESLSETNFNDPQFAALLFGEPSIEEVEEMALGKPEDSFDGFENEVERSLAPEDEDEDEDENNEDDENEDDEDDEDADEDEDDDEEDDE